jgi:hypothetical protein
MLAKKTTKNQLTLPKAVVSRFPGVDYFEVSTDGSTIVLRPLSLNRANAVLDKLAHLGISEKDVKDAVTWARKSR